MRVTTREQEKTLSTYMDEIRPTLKKMYRYCMSEQIDFNVTEAVVNAILADNNNAFIVIADNNFIVLRESIGEGD